MTELAPPPETPGRIVLERMKAFSGEDFGRVWDFYHPDSNFRSAFPDRAAYEDHAQLELSRTFRFLEWRVLFEESGTVGRVLLYNVFQRDDMVWEGIEGLELAPTEQGWRILATARLERARFPGTLETLSWGEFVRLTDGIFF